MPLRIASYAAQPIPSTCSNEPSRKFRVGRMPAGVEPVGQAGRALRPEVPALRVLGDRARQALAELAQGRRVVGELQVAAASP